MLYISLNIVTHPTINGQRDIIKCSSQLCAILTLKKIKTHGLTEVRNREYQWLH